MSDFEQNLSKISSNERTILQCLSIFWEQITAQEFASLLKHLDLKTPEGRGYSAQYLSLLRNSLVHKGVLRNTKEYWGSGFQIADEKLKEYFTREALRESWFSEVVKTIQTHFNMSEFSRWSYNGERFKFRLLRDYRLSIYQMKTDTTAELFEKIVENNCIDKATKVILQIFSNPFQKEFLSRFDHKFQTQILPVFFEQTFENSESTAELWEYVRENKIEHAIIKSFELNELIYRGEIKKAKKFIGTPDTFQKIIAGGTIALFERDYAASINHFEAAIKLWKKISSKKKGFPDNWQMFLYGLALYKTNEAKFYVFAEDFYNYANKNYPDISVHNAVTALGYFLKNNDNNAQIMANRIQANGFSDKIIGCLVSAIIPSLKLPGYAKEFAARNRVLGYRWFEFELNNLLALKEKPASSQANQAKEIAEKLQNELGFEPIGNLIPPIEDWERVLKVLTVVAENLQDKKETNAKVNETRVAWQLNFDRQEIQPIEQKYGKMGWSNGRNIALKRLFERDVKNLTEQDVSVVKNSMSRERDYSYYGGDSYDFDWEKAMAALVGHPNLFLLKNPGVNVQLVKGEPALIVKEPDDAS